MSKKQVDSTEKPNDEEKPIRSPIAVVLGHVDSGKCVTGDTLLTLDSGRIMRADEFYQEMIMHSRRLDPHCSELFAPLKIPTLSEEGIILSELTHIWKFPSTRITEVTLENGMTVKTTPEHKNIVLRKDGKIQALEAEQLEPGDYLLYPLHVPIEDARVKLKLQERLINEMKHASITNNQGSIILEFPTSEKAKKTGLLLQIHGIPVYYMNKSITITGRMILARLLDLMKDISEVSSLRNKLLQAMNDSEITEPFLKTPITVDTVDSWLSSVCMIPGMLGFEDELPYNEFDPRLSLPVLRKVIATILAHAKDLRLENEEQTVGSIVLGGALETTTVTTVMNELQVKVRGLPFGDTMDKGTVVKQLSLLHSILKDVLLLEVVDVSTRKASEPVFDFTVEGTHNFFANGAIVHNTSLLDKVRGTAVQARETGGITQHVGASFFPAESVLKAAGELAQKFNVELKIPGILIIDTPGHAAFMNLRSRGASVADIAILVVDITRGFQAQTYESMDILKRRKTPFVVALNKVDRISGWKPRKGKPFIESIRLQNKKTKQFLDEKIYEVMGELSSLGLQSDRYDRITDYTKNIAIIPTSAHTGEGIPDLFLILAGLTQQYLMKKLRYSIGPARGVVLEVKEEEGMGMTMDTIIYEGVIKASDMIVVGTTGEPEVSRVRALLLPKELDEMRDPRDKFAKADVIHASAGVKILAPDIHHVIAGAPLIVARDEEQITQAIQEIKEELSFIRLETDKEGIILKADTLGSLEALVSMLKERGIPIRIATVGDVTKRDVIEASISGEKYPSLGAILAFRVGFQGDAEDEANMNGVPIFKNDIIYGLVDEYDEWRVEVEDRLRREQFEDIQRPGKIQIMPGFVFRQNNPAVVGVEVLAGTISPRDVLLREDGKRVGTIQQIQENKKSIKEASQGKQVAISIKGPTVGRQIKEGMVLYKSIRARDARLLLNKYKAQLSPEEQATLDEIVRIKQHTEHKFWPYV